MGAIRVGIVDDHTIVASGLRALLGTLPGFEVVATAASGDEAVRAMTAEQPDVVLMDIRMPGMDGIEATRRIRAEAPGVKVLMMTMHEDDESVFAAMRAGASGYLLKGAAEGELVRALHAVVAGEAIFGPGVAERMLAYFARPASAADPFPGLTEREREVLELIAAGRNNAAIAGELFLSPKTVANHISAIFAKLGVADRAEAIVKARRHGFGDAR